jgi:uncharacterized SAM-binding protein YcdF (DUF218 family)
VYEPLRIFTQPLTFLLILLMLAAILAVRRNARPLWRWTVLVLVLAIGIVSHPFSAWVAARSLEAQYPPAAATSVLPPVRALVVLSGGLFAGNQHQGVLAEDSLMRTTCGARLAHRIAPELIVVTGGRVNPDTQASAAERMRDLLVLMGVDDQRILVEGRAMTTVGNARESRALLGPRGITRVGLVTEALHMPRAVAIFRGEGFDVVPLSCEGQAGPSFPWTRSTLLPGPRSAWLVNRAVHEWVGLAYYRLVGG